MMKVHEAANLFPMITGEAWDRFVADIKEHGQREPIIVHDGAILDGRNRAKACAELGIEPIYREWSGSGSITAWVLSTNLHRRHLDASQLAMVAARALPLFEREARERQVAAGGDRRSVSANLREAVEAKGKATEAAAATVNVSPRLVEHAAKVLRQKKDAT